MTRNDPGRVVVEPYAHGDDPNAFAVRLGGKALAELKIVNVLSQEEATARAGILEWALQEFVDGQPGRAELFFLKLPPETLQTWLTASTGHLSWRDASRFGEDPPDPPPGIGVEEHDYGWRVYLPPLRDSRTSSIDGDVLEWSPSLHAVLRLARSQGVDGVNFDCDGPELPGLPLHDWDAEQKAAEASEGVVRRPRRLLSRNQAGDQ